MSNWKDAINEHDLTTPEGLEAVKRLWVEQSREQQIEALPTLDDSTNILDTFGAIRGYNEFIEQAERRIKTANLHKVKVTDRRWMAYPFLPESEVTLLTGQGGAGKSFLLLQIGGLSPPGTPTLNSHKRSWWGAIRITTSSSTESHPTTGANRKRLSMLLTRTT